ncbi:hypothetical protein [Microlunatus panaciterrae]|uniref:hypothetical protein n=1 Tax=Microlunatus panaciterrae TaxID=400768 RepID=UPI003B832C77
MLGFRGHFASESRRYSTTLGRLRQPAVITSGPASTSCTPVSRSGSGTTQTSPSCTPTRRWWWRRGGLPGSAGSRPATPLSRPRPLPAPETTDRPGVRPRPLRAGGP